MRIQTLYPSEVRRWWGFARPLIDHVFKKCREVQIPEDVYKCLTAEPPKAFLHVFFVDEVPKGLAVTEVCGDADSRFLNVWVLNFVQNVDEHRVEILGWLDALTKAQGCTKSRFQSPRAWGSILEGAFKEKSVIYEREA